MYILKDMCMQKFYIFSVAGTFPLRYRTQQCIKSENTRFKHWWRYSAFYRKYIKLSACYYVSLGIKSFLACIIFINCQSVYYLASSKVILKGNCTGPPAFKSGLSRFYAPLREPVQAEAGCL